MVARAGENLLVVRGVPAYGAMEVELFTTPDEIAFNLQDTTPPEGVTGETDEMWLGVPALHLTGEWIGPVHARVVEDDRFEASEETIPGLSAASLTQIPFRLVPKIAMPAAGRTVPVRIRVVCADLDWSYEREVEIGVVAPDVARRKTFIDPTDDSVQYYGLLPPASFDAGRDYALVLSLHGAGVDAIGQARSYSARDWNYVVAATNRRPFGFDWEEWGRLNALAALDDAQASLRIDPTRVYLTGHSMGGHGTWHVGVTTPGRFATIGPSAGWESFYSYGGSSRPSGTIGRARAHSDTLVYLENLARRGVYIIHGDADDNVPVSEGRNLYAAVQAVTDDVVYHEEPGAGHWWDGDAAPGADCVDWPPLFDFMQARTLDPVELEFTFRSPSPAYSPRHSFVTLESAITPMEDLVVSSAPVDEETVEVTTTNVRSLSIDGAALRGRGVVTAVIDGETHAVPDGVLRIGPATGKTHDVNGPYNQVFHRAFCFVHPDEPGPAARAAAYLTSYWQIYGNGHACSVPISRVDAALRGERNLIYVGLSAEQIGRSDLPVTWTDDAVFVGGDRFWRSGMLFVFPEGDRLSAAIVATTGDPHNFYAIVPFSSRSGYPDYLVWTGSRLAATGFFDADWAYDPALREP
jgi:poly(3-hydroxybutyrate) depolymerase